MFFINHKSYILTAALVVLHVAVQSSPISPPNTPKKNIIISPVVSSGSLSPISPLNMSIAYQIANEMEEHTKQLQQQQNDNHIHYLDPITASPTLKTKRNAVQQFNLQNRNTEKIKQRQIKFIKDLGLDDSSSMQDQQNSRTFKITSNAEFEKDDLISKLDEVTNDNKVAKSVAKKEKMFREDESDNEQISEDNTTGSTEAVANAAINNNHRAQRSVENSDDVFSAEEMVKDSVAIDGIKITDGNESVSKTIKSELSDTEQSVEQVDLTGTVEADNSKDLVLAANNIVINGSGVGLQNIANKLDQVRANQLVVIQVPHNIIQHRLVSLNNIAAVSVSAEEESRDIGVWGSGSYKVSKHRGSEDIIGYRGKSSAVIIGCDKEISDSSIVGVAYSKSVVSVRFKDAIGKNVIKSNMLSIYGHQNLTSKIFTQLTGSYQSSSIRDYSDGGLGKYWMQGIGITTNIGYKSVIGQGIEVIPNIGIRYHWLIGGMDLKIDESGSRIKRSKKGVGIISGNIGAQVMLSQVRIGSGITIRPVIHGSIEGDLTRVQHKQIVMVAGEELLLANQAKRVSSGNVGANIGCVLVIKKDRVGIGIDYNHHLRRKYREHEVAIKLKIYV